MGPAAHHPHTVVGRPSKWDPRLLAVALACRTAKFRRSNLGASASALPLRSGQAYAVLVSTSAQVRRIECYAASRPQDGRTQNEDAYAVGRGVTPFAALCDGAGNAERAARRALGLFEKLIGEATVEEIAGPETWARWVRLLDSALLGGGQSTFVAVALAGDQMVGACAGDSRAYRFSRDGTGTIVTEAAPKHRLGSGHAQAFAFAEPARRGDLYLLLSDGAWTPLGLYGLRRAVAGAATRHPSELPGAILDAAGKAGRADDMTALAVRVTG